MRICDICKRSTAFNPRPVYVTNTSTINMELCYDCWNKLRKAERDYQYKAYLTVVEEVAGSAPAPEIKKKRWWQK